MSVPGPTDLFSEPATWQGTWVFVASPGRHRGLALRGGRLQPVWSNGNGGTSPVLAGGLLYVQWSGGIRVYAPTSGRQVGELPIGEAALAEPDRRRRPRRGRRGQRERPRDERRARHLPHVAEEAAQPVPAPAVSDGTLPGPSAA